MSHSKESSKRPRPSREDIETLCLLLAVGPTACTASQLAARLGLSTGLGSAVAGAAEALERSAWLTINDGQITRTADGERHLTASLAAFGVASLPRSAA